MAGNGFVLTCPDCKGAKRIILFTGSVPCERCAGTSELDRDIMGPAAEMNAITDSGGGVIGYTMTGLAHDFSD